MKSKLKKIFIVLACAALMLSLAVIGVGAEDANAENTDGGNFFSEVYTEIREHAAEILSAMTFIGSVVLSVSYRNGLIPTMKKGVGGLGSIASEIKEDSKEYARIAKENQAVLKERLERLEDTLGIIEEALEATGERLSELCRDKEERGRVEAVINEQVSLLYDVFMYSSMPEYQKDAVGRRVESMRRTLGTETDRNEVENEC